ncbi:Hsp70 family protein [Oceaniovalibus sp. ACAM 378]|uniref:Hsp70 family protein n=1 Tax=Oceaniovalibus sp. ACAM 378 TaxID=2599923 RepID=UPI0011D3D08A|nr:Hsp70 family protein [Oceaniovalibus sp. ACAM 378]TYB88000.1 Hsp70 family protein [Oceaniovalibus sp. ACAM 378]
MATLGIDFGTSNSACGVLVNGRPHLIEIEPGEKTLPTAVFFDFDARRTLFGHSANRALIAGTEGRYMRALKRVLGTSLMREKRQLMNERVDFIDIIARFLSRLKTGAEAACHTEFTHALSGRPVHFHSSDPVRDAQALTDLTECYARAGFAAVEFLYEPEAAAIANGALSTDGPGLIVDIGGGTSDFTLYTARAGAIEVLASHGLRLGGTNFDRRLSLDHAMPLFGAGGAIRNTFGDGALPAPNGLFHDLASWEKIPFLYSAQTLRDVRAMARQAVDHAPFTRLLSVLELELGHDIAFAVERGKIAANAGTGRIDLAVVERGLDVALTAGEVGVSLSDQARAIGDAAGETCAMSGVAPKDVGSVVFVGGSSLMQVVIDRITEMFPGADQKRSDPFTGVVDGLAISSASAFR